MGKNSRADDPIVRLLQDRQQYATWLSRLDATADTAPETVRGKIRADYQARLDQVIEELRSHADGLAQQLDRHRETRAELQTREAQAKEIMSEAEVRHAVGEYTDAKWQQIRGEAQKNLVAIREELASLSEEIAELEKVQQMISAPAMPESVPAPPPPMAAVAPEPETQVTGAEESLLPHLSAGEPEPPAPEPTAPPEFPAPTLPVSPRAEAETPSAPARPPRPKDAAQAGRTLWFPSVKDEEVNSGVDELAFLKSVSEDEKTGPSARRASGGVPRPPLEASAPAPVPAPSSSPSNTGLESGRPSTSTGARTLKCGECGTMNRPTEWYCERCGAELADL